MRIPRLLVLALAFHGAPAAAQAPSGARPGQSPPATPAGATGASGAANPNVVPEPAEKAAAKAAGAVPGAQQPAAAAPPSRELKPAIIAPTNPATAEDLTPTAPMVTHGPNDRPFRLGYFSLSPLNERQKPIAALDPAGIAVNSGILIAQFDGNWVGGLSMGTKKVQWWFDGVTTMTLPPGSFGNSFVVGFRDGRLVRLEATTGKKIWAATLDSFSERPLLLSGNTLYVVTAAQVLYAIDFQSGKTNWLFDGGFPDGLTIRSGTKPVFHDGKVMFGLASGEVVAVAADSGKLIWRYNPAYNDARFHDLVGEMIVRGGNLLITRYDGLVAAIDLNSPVRSVIWQEKLPGLTTSTFRGDRLYVGGQNGDVYAIDPDNGGRRLWRAMTGVPVTTLTAGETSLFVTGAGGRVTALELAKGGLEWADNLGSALSSLPVLLDSAIYFETGMKAVYAYRVR